MEGQIVKSDRTPVQHAESKRAWRIGMIVSIVLAAVVFAQYLSIRNAPVDYESDLDQFKFGSIGSDVNGLPYWIWKVLPEMFPEKLPGEGYQSLGFILDAGKDRLIGFSRRKVLFDRVGLNCASCHTGRVRESAFSQPMHFPLMPSHQLNLQGYFGFLFDCARDERFNKTDMMKAINRMTELSWLESLIYPYAIGQTQELLLAQAEKVSWMNSRPPWGPGRVDTFNPYKTLIFNLDMTNDTSIGTADFESIWHQEIREGKWLHWDGNNNSVDERNISASIGAGASYETVDLPRLHRIKNWIWTAEAPEYPFAVDAELAERGEPLYMRYCYGCHGQQGEKFGEVIPLEEIGTDPERCVSFDGAMAARMNTIGEGYPWRFTHFRETNGYVNKYMDGLWARAPFLHNGSVPTMRDLLNRSENRPKQFYAGYDVYDQRNLGFVSSGPGAEANGHLFDTTLRGNSNSGHEYATDLGDSDKDALIEYMKTL